MKSIECYADWQWDDFAFWPSLTLHVHRCEDPACRTFHGFALHLAFLGAYVALVFHWNDQA